MKDEIVLYQPNETIQLEVHLRDETVWLTQQQIADLFGVKQPAISKHIANIYKSGELDEEGTYSILEYMGHDGIYSIADLIRDGEPDNDKASNIANSWIFLD